MDTKEQGQDVFDLINKEGKVLREEKSKHKIYSSAKSFPNVEIAKREFISSKEKLFLINAWSNIRGIVNASFILYNKTGDPLPRQYPMIGDFIMVDLPGPLPIYWVEVTSIGDQENAAQIIVKPTTDPTKGGDKTITDHFFRDEARIIFRVERNGKEVRAMEIGINGGRINKDDEAGDKGVTNTLVAEGGWAGFQKHKWKNLTDYLVGVT